MVASYGAFAIRKGDAANITAATATRGRNHLGISIQSVMSGSKVHNASVTNTTSSAISSATQNRTSASSTSGCNSAAVARTPAMMTGTVIGYNSTGSSTSRLRARTSIAENSVPTVANPIVPLNSTAPSQSGCDSSG